MESKISSLVDAQFIAKTLKDMIQINSVNPFVSQEEPTDRGPGEGLMANAVAEVLKGIGCSVKMQYISENRRNVIGRLHSNESSQTLLLTSHLDTVGVEGMANPFEPVEQNGNIYGRGASDSKGQLAAMLGALDGIIKSGLRPYCNILFAGVCDEEDQSIGTSMFLNEYNADFAIVGEPTELKIVTAHKGFAWFLISTYGKSVHGSIPESGVDAISHMGKLIAGIERLKDRFKNMQHSLLGEPKMHFGTIRGGKGPSTVPDCCKLTVELRTVSRKDTWEFHKWIMDEINQLSSQIPGFNASCEITLERYPLETSLESTPVIKLSHAISQVLKKAPEMEIMQGWTDAALIREKMPTVIFGAGSSKCAHANIECISLAELFLASEILAHFILNL